SSTLGLKEWMVHKWVTINSDKNSNATEHESNSSDKAIEDISNKGRPKNKRHQQDEQRM
ncbi:hypothetical protein J6590_093784, partial [Homalodisca vitripennis]